MGASGGSSDGGSSDGGGACLEEGALEAPEALQRKKRKGVLTARTYTVSGRNQKTKEATCVARHERPHLTCDGGVR